MIKFFYNGIKDQKGATLQKASYSKGGYTTKSGLCFETITIYAKSYEDFSEKVSQAFKVENETELTTDYMMKDFIRVSPSHPLYKEVNEACEKYQARWA